MGNAISSLSNKTVGGWLVIGLAMSYASYSYFLKNSQGNRHARPRGREAFAGQPKKENKAKKQRVEQFTKSKPASYADAAAQPAEPKVAPEPSKPTKSKDEIDDRQFAQRMAHNKQDKFANKSSSDQKHKQKSVKQSKAKKANGASKQTEANTAIDTAAEEPKESAPSSVADAEATDDQSPITSPSVSAADAAGVADMLEKPSAGPGAIRLTNTEEKPKPAKKPKTPEPTETKKQRQNRQKKEQEKAVREEQEKERKRLEEAQRRTAREAEGRAAKDGSAFMAAQKANAWAEKKANGVSQKDAPAAHQPLDTFDVDSESTAKASIAPVATTNGKGSKENVQPTGKKSDWAEIQVSEEEQMKMLAEDEDFTPVTSKKSKRAQKANTGVASSDDGSVNGSAAPAPAAATTSGPASKPKAAATNGRPKPQSIPTQSSFAALADDGADLEEEEEQVLEWDV